MLLTLGVVLVCFIIGSSGRGGAVGAAFSKALGRRLLSWWTGRVCCLERVCERWLGCCRRETAGDGGCVGGGGCVSGAGVLAAARERNSQSEMKLEAGSEQLKPCLGARCSLLHAGQVPT